MSRNLAIDVGGLGKQYRIGGQQRGYRTLREALVDTAAAPARRLRAVLRSESATLASQTFWALKDVSFEVKQGEVLGVIGRNGAGKSTLLKILSRITEPTEGYADLYGRVGSLLEVGTGFHHELTGRENIYLSGAILGMSRAEVEHKFDEIMDFAGIERFIDTPIKRYSSGMHVRLGFAVAAHLDPEILLIDEVLAVGDAAFQKKCLGKMSGIAGSGRTILFVSHNMGAVANLCTRVMVLEEGRILFAGDVEAGIVKYLEASGAVNARANLASLAHRGGPTNVSRLLAIETLGDNGAPTSQFRMGSPLRIKLYFRVTEEIENLEIGFGIRSSTGALLHTLVSHMEGFTMHFPRGEHSIVCEIPSLHLFPGHFNITPWLKLRRQRMDDEISSAITFEVLSHDITGHNPSAFYYPNSGVYETSNWRFDD